VVDLMAHLRASLESKGAAKAKSRTASKKSASKPGRRKSKHAA